MKELMSLPDNDIQAMVCFFETNGSFFKVGDANFESLYFEDVIEIINRLKATVAFMNKIESPEIDYERMISLTLYLHLSQKISIELSTLPRLYVSYKHFLSNEIDKASQLTEIDGQQEAFQKDTYTIRDSIYGSYELDIEEYNDVVSENIYENRYPGYLDMRYKAIVPLRTAASKILREQMVGRGLRLPYGERTGDKDVDAVMLTAHDKFQDILAEAQKGDSIFKAGNVIQAEEELDEPEEIVYTQLSLDIDQNETLEQAYVQTGLPTSEENDILLQTAKAYLQVETINYIAQNGKVPFVLAHPEKKKIVQTVTQKLEENQDWGKIFKNNENPFLTWLEEEAEQTYTTIIGKFIPIPRIRVTDAGVEEYIFVDFDLDLSVFTHMPIKNELLIQNLEDMSDRERIKGDAIDFEGYHPEKVILTELHKKPEIDYERCSKLLFKLITQVCDHYETGYGINGMQNIVMMYRREIAGKIYDQMMKHFYCENGLFQEEVIDVEYSNLPQKLNCRQKVGLYDDFKENYEGHIKSVLFTGIKKGVYPEAKFDSDESELTLARLLDRDDDVLKWLRPAPNEFNITYNRGKRYEPDFVVETADCCYLVEVKGENKLTDPDVLDKKKRGIQYCDVSTRWCKANGYKPWRYLFIPSKQVLPNSSFAQLAKRFQEQ